MDRDGEGGINRFRRDNEAFRLPKGDYEYLIDRPDLPPVTQAQVYDLSNAVDEGIYRRRIAERALGELWVVDDLSDEPIDASHLDFWFNHIAELAGVNTIMMGTAYRYPLRPSFHRSADETDD